MPTIGSRATSTYAYESLTVTNAVAVGFTVAVMLASHRGPGAVVISVENNDIRFRSDGLAPTTTEGHIMPAGSSMEVLAGAIGRFKMIAIAGDAIVRISYGDAL